jgi:ABC-2 type transport system permease protein
VVISDRENYRMLKYIFISPAQFQAYFLGRGIAGFAEGVLGACITITVGVMIPDVRRSVNYEAFNLGWLLVYLGIGSIMLWACGMILASAMLNMSRSGTFLSEGIAGVLHLLSGVVFPISRLPEWLQYISRGLPTTYWLEGMRRAIVGAAPPESELSKSPLANWSNGELAGMLAITTAVLVVVSQLFYRRSVKRAWKRGKIEEATGM